MAGFQAPISGWFWAPADNLGSLFPDVEKLAGADRYPLAFPNGRFRTFEDYRAAARDKVLDLLLYRPAKVDPRPEVVGRVDRDDHVRETVLFSTGPAFRVPAYVLIPKGLRGPPRPSSICTRTGGCSSSARRRSLISAPTTPP